jgi:hypothetical protein
VHFTETIIADMEGAISRQMRAPWRCALADEHTLLTTDDDLMDLFDRFNMYYRGWMVVRYLHEVGLLLFKET